jgi:hypothetical protein
MGIHVAKFRLSRLAIVKFLGLPDGTNIVKIFEDNNVVSGDFTFVIEHPSFEESEIGKAIPEYLHKSRELFVSGEPELGKSRLVSYELLLEKPEARSENKI